MAILRVRLSKEKLAAMPAVERRLFLMLGTVSNEIRVLLKMLLWTGDYSSSNAAVRHGQISMSLMFLRLLAGKLKEGHRVLQRDFFGAAVSRDYVPNLPDSAQLELKEII